MPIEQKALKKKNLCVCICVCVSMCVKQMGGKREKLERGKRSVATESLQEHVSMCVAVCACVRKCVLD